MASDYFARAEQLANRSDDPLDIIFSNIFHSIAYFSSGNTKECLKLVDINRQIMEVNGTSPSVIATIFNSLPTTQRPT